MLNKLDQFFSNLSSLFLFFLICLLIAGVGLFGYLIGYELSSSLFYLIPICIATWYATAFLGYLTCFLSAITWLSVDYILDHSYSHFAIPFWNAAVRLGFFLIIVYFLLSLKAANKTLESLAQTDGLTGLNNMRSFKDKCELYIQIAARKNHSLALAYIDLDGFKNINDTYGHNVGDQVLTSVAGVISARLRVTDIAARLGGDEFAILLSDSEINGAKIFFESLHQSLHELAKQNNWLLGYSIGVAVLHSFSGGAGEAIRIADSLMYDIKKSGKNNIRFAEFYPPFNAK